METNRGAMRRLTIAATSQTGMVTAQELHARGARNIAAILVRRVTELYIGTTQKAQHRPTPGLVAPGVEGGSRI